MRRGSGASGGGGVQFQNALIGQQDLSGKSRFHTSNNTQRMFGIVAKLCEIGKDSAKKTIQLIMVTFLQISVERIEYFTTLLSVNGFCCVQILVQAKYFNTFADQSVK